MQDTKPFWGPIIGCVLAISGPIIFSEGMEKNRAFLTEDVFIWFLPTITGIIISLYFMLRFRLYQLSVFSILVTFLGFVLGFIFPGTLSRILCIMLAAAIVIPHIVSARNN